MPELIQQNWIFLIIALIIGLLTAWWIFAASRRTKVEIERTDEGAPAKRNQALIDAPPATTPKAEARRPTPAGLSRVNEAAPEETAPVEARPAPAAQPAPAADDDLTRIKGLGPKIAQQLKGLGVTSFAQVAAWDDAEIDRIDAQLGRFQGRIRRDDWPTQARFLSSGDTAGYEAKFGKL